MHISKNIGVKTKSKPGLYNKQIKSELIKEYLDNVENENYEQKINDVVALKWPKIKGENLHQRKAKLIQHLMGKGYEYDKFKSVVNALKVSQLRDLNINTSLSAAFISSVLNTLVSPFCS
jgi:SOS response regulatory protein OraA/RecX